MKKIYTLLTISMMMQYLLSAQVVYTVPEFPTQTDVVTVYFDATMGNAGLAGYTGDVYAHTGVITSNSTSPSDWKYVQGEWGTSNAPLMTRVSPDLYSLTMTIEDYYGVPDTEVVEQLAFVFRSLDGSISGRDTDGADIYTSVYDGGQGLLVQLISPSENGTIIFDDESISIKLNVNTEANIIITDNGEEIVNENSDGIDITLADRSIGNHDLVITVSDGNETLTLTSNYIVIDDQKTYENPPSGLKNGLNYYTDESYIFQLTAPHKAHAFLLCPANGYRPSLDYRMNLASDDATFWIELPVDNFTNGNNTYQYLVDGSITVADPYSEVVLDPFNDQWVEDDVLATLPTYPGDMTTGIVTAFDIIEEDYPWVSSPIVKPAKTDLVIYELLMRDFLSDHSYESLLDTLDYLQDLGVNAIELMPINEFEGNNSWGYNPSFHMATDKYYGTRDQLKAVIDEAHSRGITVILDVVYNHVFSQSPLAQLFWNAESFQPASDNPWLNVTAKHPFNVGYDVNHESFVTKQWVKQVLSYWIEEFRIDGFRLDLSKGFTQFNSGNNAGLMSQYDASRIAILKDYADHIWSLDPTNYVILEHFASNTEEKELSEYGMMLWGNIQHEFAEAAMGYSSNISGADYTQRGWSDPNLVAYAESHDEERMLYKLLEFGNDGPGHDTQNPITAYKRAEAANAVFYSIPGPKMLWQFEELGYDYSINYCEGGGISDDCRLDRKPVRWDYAQDEGRKHIYAVIAAMTHLKTTYPTFATTDFDLSNGSYIKKVHLMHPDMNAVTLANFQVTEQNVNPEFITAGTWYEYFSGDSLMVTNVEEELVFAPGEYRVYTDKKISPPEVFFTDTKDLEIIGVSLYPNPVFGSNYVTLLHSNLRNIDHVTLVDQMGKQQNMSYDYDGQELSISLDADVPPGIYTVTIVTNTKIYTGRVVKM